MHNDRSGFTLVELVIVVMIIGILAVLALPKFAATREASFFATMQADLDNLRGAQEVYFQTSGAFSYTSDINQLELQLTRGVTITTLNVLNAGQAWEAVATHTAVAGGACVVGFGDIGGDSWSASGGTPVVAVTAESAGAPICNND